MKTRSSDHDPVVTEAVPGIHRVELDGVTVGYVLEAGAVFVSLRGQRLQHVVRDRAVARSATPPCIASSIA